MISHVGENNSVLEQGEDAVHPRLTVGVMPPVTIHSSNDTGKVSREQNFLVMKRFFLHCSWIYYPVTASRKIILLKNIYFKAFSLIIYNRHDVDWQFT